MAIFTAAILNALRKRKIKLGTTKPPERELDRWAAAFFLIMPLVFVAVAIGIASIERPVDNGNRISSQLQVSVNQ